MRIPDSIRLAVLLLSGFLAVSQASASDPTSEATTVGPVKLDPKTATVIDDNTVIPFTSSDSGTLTVGANIVLGCSPPITGNVIYGFLDTRSSGNFGSYSPTGLTGGKTVGVVIDIEPGTCVGSQSSFTVTGFSSSPGSSWLSSITCNGTQNSGSGATFSYSSGDATWVWSQLFGLSSKYKDNVSCTIVHN